MSEHQQERQEAARTQTESRAAASAHEYGIKAQTAQVNDRKQNPRFYDKYTRSSVEESDRWEGIVDEFSIWLADDHVLSNRRQIHRQQREILNKTRAQQAIVGRTPGARLREKPFLNALAQGVNVELDEAVALDAAGQQAHGVDDPQYAPPIGPEERSALDDLGNLATARQAMGVDQAGSEALTTATTESRTVREEESEETGITGSISGVFD